MFYDGGLLDNFLSGLFCLDVSQGCIVVNLGYLLLILEL